MYVCICAAVNDATIREAVAGGVHDWKTLCNEHNIAKQCGKCACLAREIFLASLEKTAKESTTPVREAGQ